MTGMILFSIVILLVVAALEVTHRRSAASWHPGRDARRDRDAARLADELRTLEQSAPPAREAHLLHLNPPTSAATDARLITRTAA